MSYGKLERSETKIITPYSDGTITALHPFERGNFFSMAKNIPKEQRANVSMASSALRYAYENKDDIAQNIRQLMKEGIGYFYDGILWTPEGVYVESNPKFDENAKNSNDLIMNEKDLQSRLSSREEQGVIYSEDSSVRFVPYGFNIGKQSYNELAKNPFVLALAGPEGADNLSYIASQHKGKPYLFALQDVKEPIKGVARLSSFWYGLDWGRLNVGGYAVGDDDYGFSFRVVHEKNISIGNK